MSVTTLTHTELLSELIAEAVREHVGSVGVLVRDVPAPDPLRLIDRLTALSNETEVPFKIAYLRPGGPEAAAELGLDAETFSIEVEQAERWRNQRALEALIVVVAHGDEAKLSSLEEFAAITAPNLKRVLVDRALGEEAGLNDVQTRWWGQLAADDSIGLAQLAEYYLALKDKKGAEFLSASSREIFRLGLLPDPKFFNDGADRAMRKRLQANRDLVVRLQTLTPRDRKTITKVVGEASDEGEQKRLREALDKLHRARWEGEGMQAIPFEAAERLIKARTKKTVEPGGDDGQDGAERGRDEHVAAVAAESLVDEARAGDVKAIVDRLTEKLLALDESRLRPEKIKTELPDTANDAHTTARVDVINLVSKLLDDGVYGGLIETESLPLEDFLRRFEPEHHVIARWERDRISEFLQVLAVDSAGEELAARFNAYDEARTAVLPLLQSLAVEPLAVAAHAATRAKLLAAINAHNALSQQARENYDQLFDKFGPDANEVLGLLLLLETIVVRAGEQTYAIAAPTHPLYLWHYATYSEIVEKQRARLDERDRQLVIDAAGDLPNFLTSLFVPPTAFGAGLALPYLGRIGPLPYFGERAETSPTDDGVAATKTLIEAYVALEPHARLGFRLALVDPPAVGTFLAMVADLAEAGALLGAHVLVYRHASAKLTPDLGLDESDEDRVAQLFRSLAHERRFTFEVRDLPEREVGPPEDEAAHLLVIFARSGGQPNRARATLHPIQPLAVPRRLHYSQLYKTVELEPAPGGPFDNYDKLVSRLAQGGGASYLSVHQDAKLRQALNFVASRVAWTAITDRHVDRDLQLGALRVFTAREGERDIAGFARAAVSFRRPLREVVRNYNAFISDVELDDLLVQLSDLLDSGLLNLRPDATGRTNHSRVKGLLGTLIAARWFRQSPNRLLISLDSPEARRWLHLSDDPHRADLVGLEWTDDHCTVSVIEVKAVQAAGAEYAVDLEGFVSGAAVDQMLATRRLLGHVFTTSSERDDELITTPARREIVREHLYRELTKATYDPDDRRVWAERLQRLLDGEVSSEIRCQLVDVRLGVDASTLEERNVVARDGEATVPVRITELNEQLIDALQQAEPPDAEAAPPPEPPGAEAVGAEPVTEAEPVDEPGAAPTRGEEPPAETAPRDTPTPVSPREVAEADRARAMLGTAPGAYGKEREIWLDPALPGEQLPNPHVAITGETGSGKTQATKAIIRDLHAHGLPALVLDFKDDYSDPAYAETEGMQVYDPGFESLPFNPLVPPVDPRSGHANPTHHIYQLADIIKRIYGLGDQQSYRVREALKRAYDEAGVPMKAFEPAASQAYPPFEAVQAQLEAEKGNDALLGRMSPIFDLGLFASDAGAEVFATVADASTVVRLGHLPGDETKNSVAEFFLMALYNHLIRRPQTHTLDRLLVLDEAWRLVESPFLEPLMREGRAFGLGVIIATQFPRDLPEAVMGSTATKLFFSQTQLEQIREIQRTVVGKTSGPDADHLAGVMRGLAPLSCVLHSKQHAPFVRVTIKPYFERHG